ncbi:MAG: site-specific DNA-methyltransferase [Bacteroidetes bacterium]|nr:MAG: site-specific DNA-methyltransferase [Bacteroidota bacterium]
MVSKSTYSTFDDLASIYLGDFKKVVQYWDAPTTIISDGPYGIGGFPGDPETPAGLGEWYEPHIKIWSKKSSPVTTLWFWNTELGWATVHPFLEANDWEFVNCHIWNKGKAHIAGNANTKTLRKLPVVTEVCVQYVKKAKFEVDGNQLSMQDWLRYEWQRTGLPLTKTNEACGVKNAATRKYFTKCHLWYFPPADAFEKLSDYANTYGDPSGKPYFSVNGKTPLSKSQWEHMRAKFKCPFGVTNVWDYPPLNGKERLKNGFKALHLNQKPLKLMRLIIEMSSEEGDVIWEPFGGLCSGSVAAYKVGRKSFAAEINEDIYKQAVKRIAHNAMQPTLNF